MTNKQSTKPNEAHVFRFTMLAFALGMMFVLPFLVAFTSQKWWFMSLVGGSITGGYTFYRRTIQHDFINRMIHAPKTQVVESVREVYRNLPRNTAVIESDGTIIVINQPEPGAFAELLRGAASPGKEMFSLRRALRSGYNEQEYRVLVAQLRLIGWLGDEMVNDAPRINERKRDEIESWLGMREVR